MTNFPSVAIVRVSQQNTPGTKGKDAFWNLASCLLCVNFSPCGSTTVNLLRCLLRWWSWVRVIVLFMISSSCCWWVAPLQSTDHPDRGFWFGKDEKDRMRKENRAENAITQFDCGRTVSPDQKHKAVGEKILKDACKTLKVYVYKLQIQ